ncbi:GDSL lipase/esterase [Dillenia turbinata]|uniref:GDSL lipase/esterase n=1 Tax=Dillenia turbinata TaxID=194707 RepID=A0AAN8UZ22_9MAGN
MRTLFFLLLFSFNLELFHGYSTIEYEEHSLSSDECCKTSNLPALYVFGDSLIECGNNKHLPKAGRVDFLPYGIDFNRIPTGRVTNGKTVVDFIALKLGLPFAPAYLTLLEFQRRKISTGISYASAGSGILPDIGGARVGACLSFDDQMDLFQSTVENDLSKQFKQQRELNEHLSNSLFFISFGVNDYSNYVKHLNDTKCHRSPEDFAEFLLNKFGTRLKRLYNLGARKFLVNNVAAIGCIPGFIKRWKYQFGNCVDSVNHIVNLYNERLPGYLQNLQSQYPETTFMHMEFFKFFLDININPQKYGITNTTNACCVLGEDLGCIPNEAPCEDRDKHLYFDINHPSQVANYLFVKQYLSDSMICKLSNVTGLW